MSSGMDDRGPGEAFSGAPPVHPWRTFENKTTSGEVEAKYLESIRRYLAGETLFRGQFLAATFPSKALSESPIKYSGQYSSEHPIQTAIWEGAQQWPFRLGLRQMQSLSRRLVGVKRRHTNHRLHCEDWFERADRRAEMFDRTWS
jgi:hypothetical protein